MYITPERHRSGFHLLLTLPASPRCCSLCWVRNHGCLQAMWKQSSSVQGVTSSWGSAAEIQPSQSTAGLSTLPGRSPNTHWSTNESASHCSAWQTKRAGRTNVPGTDSAVTMSWPHSFYVNGGIHRLFSEVLTWGHLSFFPKILLIFIS